MHAPDTLVIRPAARVLVAVSLAWVLGGALVAGAHQDHAAPEPTPEAPIVEEQLQAAPDEAAPDEAAPDDAPREAAAHELAGDDERAEAPDLPGPLAWLGKLHPAVVNFPIAMLLGAALAEVLSMAASRELFVHAARFCLWLGATTAVVAALLGWLFGGFRWVDDEWILTTHRWLGTATAMWALLVLGLSERSARGRSSRGSYRAALVAGAALVAVTGFFGGALLYGLDHFAW